MWHKCLWLSLFSYINAKQLQATAPLINTVSKIVTAYIVSYLTNWIPLVFIVNFKLALGLNYFTSDSYNTSVRFVSDL